jgi:hypothetical protein
VFPLLDLQTEVGVLTLSAASESSDNTAAIIGGVVGGVAAICLIAAAAIFASRRRRLVSLFPGSFCEQCPLVAFLNCFQKPSTENIDFRRSNLKGADDAFAYGNVMNSGVYESGTDSQTNPLYRATE